MKQVEWHCPMCDEHNVDSMGEEDFVECCGCGREWEWSDVLEFADDVRGE